MALALQVDTLEGLPEALHGLYTEVDGKFALDVDGLPDTKGLKSALDSEREAAKLAKKANAELLKKYDGIDPEKTRAMYARFENDKEAQLMADGKIDEVVELRYEKKKVEMQRQVDDAEDRAAKYSQRVLDNHILAAAAKSGLHKHAIEDALFRGRNLFALAEDGSAVQLGADSKPVYGKDGKTLFSPDEWLEGSKEWAPHWHPAGSSGGGASGGANNGHGGQKIITRSQYLGKPPEEQKAIGLDKTIKVVDD